MQAKATTCSRMAAATAATGGTTNGPDVVYLSGRMTLPTKVKGCVHDCVLVLISRSVEVFDIVPLAM